ncbi:MAG: hypothetical protein AAF720_14290 [Pseudomonadota bacterium]
MSGARAVSYLIGALPYGAAIVTVFDETLLFDEKSLKLISDVLGV